MTGSTDAAHRGSRAEQEQGPVFLLDGNNIAYRAFYALPQEIATSDGIPTNALYGFCLMVIKILSDYHPSRVIVAWDSREKTFRHEEFQEYKAQRKPMPDLLSEQWPHLVQLTEAFGFSNLAVPGYEADDILATLARRSEADGRETMIVTGDRDALQLAGEHVSIMSNTKGMTEVKVYDPAAVEERFGVSPRLIPDLIGLKGDSSDNIPGIPGIGEKTASSLLDQFGSLEEVLDHADEVSGAKRKELLKEHRELALLSKKLALLDRDAPIEADSTATVPWRPDLTRLKELFTRFEFASLLRRVEALLPEDDEEGDASGNASDAVGSGVAAEGGGSSGAQDRWRSAALAPARRVSAGKGAPKELVDWARRVGLAMDEAGGLWVAQATAESSTGEGGDYAGLVVARVDGPVDGEQELRKLLAKGQIVCHDYKAAAGLHGLVERVDHDTYLAGYLLDPGQRGYELQDLARAAGLVLPAWGGWEQEADESIPTEGAIAAALTLAVAPRQEEALRAQGMWDLFEKIELPLTEVLLAMEGAGVHLDTYRLGEITGKVQDQLEGLEASIYESAGESFNLGSPQQMGRILFDHLGLPRQRKTKTGYSTDARTLEALRGSHPIVGDILAHRELSKLMSTYLLALPEAVDPQTGRLHTTFHQAVAATGRLSSSDPNLQNIPIRTALGAQIRQCFTAEPGHVLVVADYSQIELRVMAHLSKEPALLESFARGEDIHTRTAAEVFGLAEGEVDAEHRRYAKAVNFGIMYGQTAFGLSQTLGIEREEAAEYIERYFERLPRVKAFIEETIEAAKQHGYVASVYGRRRLIPELRSENFQERSLGERLAVNSVIQGSAADIIKVAMIRCHELLQADFTGARLLLQVHDELVFEVPEKLAEKVRVAVSTQMASAYPMDPPLGVDSGVGSDWASAK